jgi:AraC family transcriptional regulator
MSSSVVHEQTYAEHLGLIILCELRDALLGKCEAPAFRGGLTPQQLNHVRDYITANLGGDISVSALAGLINLSRFHFIRAFKKATGMAPYHFVLSSRVERAKQLLVEPHFSIACCCKIGWLSQHPATGQGVPPICRHDAFVLSAPSCRQYV